MDPLTAVSLAADLPVTRMAVAALCGALVGFQRERAHRPAGVRTYALVTLGSAMFTIATQRVGMPIAAQVVTGVGFLGTGTVLRHGDMVLGLTTAAGIWMMAAVGMAVGFGWYDMGLAGTLMSLLIFSFMGPIAKPDLDVTEHTLQLELASPDALPAMVAILEAAQVRVSALDHRLKDGKLMVELSMHLPVQVTPTVIAGRLAPLARRIHWVTGP